MAVVKELVPAFQHRKYLFRRKVFKLFGGAFHVYDALGRLVLYSQQKAFKLREDFRVYSDENISATYDVYDATTGEAVGAIKRKGLKSIVMDEWIFLSNGGQEIGKLAETSVVGALLTRFINLIPTANRSKAFDCGRNPISRY
jgi:hypothetical protein